LKTFPDDAINSQINVNLRVEESESLAAEEMGRGKQQERWCHCDRLSGG